MMTNTYLPHVGGVTNSVAAFTKELRNQGHHVMVVAPEYKQAIVDPDVIRIPAIQNFNGSDFSVVLPIPGFLKNRLEEFKPDIVHSHHPFLVGSTALRISTKCHTPLVYTYHTMFEKYTHYVPVDFPRMKHFVISLSIGYSNMADTVIAPSESVAEFLKSKKMESPIEVVPTGIDTAKFKSGDGRKVRASCNIPPDAFVAGHVGRLAPEKNLDFLSEAAASFLHSWPDAHFIIVGYGSLETTLKEFFIENNLQDRVHFLGKLRGRDVVDAYHAMNVFIFSSKSETQGLVLTEAMAAGVPVIALDASGVREVVDDCVNGCLLFEENVRAFTRELSQFCRMTPETRKRLTANAVKTAEGFTLKNSVSKLLLLYERLKKERVSKRTRDESVWKKSIEHIKMEWDLFSNISSAVGDAIQKHKY